MLSIVLCVTLFATLVSSQELIDVVDFQTYSGAGLKAGGGAGKLDSNAVRVHLNNGEKTAYGDDQSAKEFGNGLIGYAERKTHTVFGSIGAIEVC
jgi:hypothetical protein